MLAKMLAGRLRGEAALTWKWLVSRSFSRADARIRTGDPFITSEVLYQLSYVGEAQQR